MSLYSLNYSSQIRETSIGLLDRVKKRDEQAWRRFVRIYGPLIYGWVRRSGLQAVDAEDVVADVFADLVTSLGRFRRDPAAGYRFRGWLRTVCRRKIIKHMKRLYGRPHARQWAKSTKTQTHLAGNGAEACHEVSRLRHRTVLLLRDEFKPHHWQAFWRTAVEGNVPSDVAEDMGISVWAVYKAKSRLLRRLRVELSGLLEPDEMDSNVES